MKLAFISVLFLSFLSTFEKCDKKQMGEVMPILGDTLNLVMNEALIIPEEKLSLTLKKVKDSRCPLYTNCVRAGEAIVSLQVDKAPESKTIEMESKGNCQEADAAKCGDQKAALGYTFKLLNVYPYPGSDEAKARGPQVVRMIVTK